MMSRPYMSFEMAISQAKTWFPWVEGNVSVVVIRKDFAPTPTGWPESIRGHIVQHVPNIVGDGSWCETSLPANVFNSLATQAAQLFDMTAADDLKGLANVLIQAGLP